MLVRDWCTSLCEYRWAPAAVSVYRKWVAFRWFRKCRSEIITFFISWICLNEIQLKLVSQLFTDKVIYWFCALILGVVFFFRVFPSYRFCVLRPLRQQRLWPSPCWSSWALSSCCLLTLQNSTRGLKATAGHLWWASPHCAKLSLKEHKHGLSFKLSVFLSKDFVRCVTASIIYFIISIMAVSKYDDGSSKAAGVTLSTLIWMISFGSFSPEISSSSLLSTGLWVCCHYCFCFRFLFHF